jgi:hypothetical protein
VTARTAQDGIAAAVRAGAAAAALDLDWGLIFAIDYDGGTWTATRRDGTGTLISALSPDDLAMRMRAAWDGGGR